MNCNCLFVVVAYFLSKKEAKFNYKTEINFGFYSLLNKWKVTVFVGPDGSFVINGVFTAAKMRVKIF